MTRTLHQQATDRIYEDAYEYAAEEGYVRWMGATSVDPGCWSGEIDVEIEFWPLVDEDEEIVPGYERARAEARFGNTIIFDRSYEITLDAKGYLWTDWEDV